MAIEAEPRRCVTLKWIRSPTAYQTRINKQGVDQCVYLVRPKAT